MIPDHNHLTQSGEARYLGEMLGRSPKRRNLVRVPLRQ